MATAGGYDEYAFVADLYDWVVPYRERSDVAFFVDAAREAGGPVLEVGCGTGRVLLAIARAEISRNTCWLCAGKNSDRRVTPSSRG